MCAWSVWCHRAEEWTDPLTLKNLLCGIIHGATRDVLEDKWDTICIWHKNRLSLFPTAVTYQQCALNLPLMFYKEERKQSVFWAIVSKVRICYLLCGCDSAAFERWYIPSRLCHWWNTKERGSHWPLYICKRKKVSCWTSTWYKNNDWSLGQPDKWNFPWGLTEYYRTELKHIFKANPCKCDVWCKKFGLLSVQWINWTILSH